MEFSPAHVQITFQPSNPTGYTEETPAINYFLYWCVIRDSGETPFTEPEMHFAVSLVQ